MQTQAIVVIEHSEEEVIGATTFSGKGALKEARAHFVDLVTENIEEGRACNAQYPQEKESRKTAKLLLKQDKLLTCTLGRYCCGNFFVTIVRTVGKPPF